MYVLPKKTKKHVSFSIAIIMQNFSSQDFEELLISGSGMAEDNYSSCAASTLQAANGTLLPAPIAISARVFQIIYGCLLVSLGILLNVLILVLVFRFKKLRTISFGIATQIAIADMGVTITHGIPLVVNNIAGRWVLGLDLCIISALVILMLVTMRTLLIFVFSFDRFASVFAPFFYPKYSRRITILMCVLAWSIGIAISLIAIPPIADCYIFSEPALSCSITTTCSKKCTILLFTHMATIIIPAIFTTVGFFLALYIKGRKFRHQDSQMLGLTEDMTDQEWRAMKTFFLLFLAVFAVTILPYFLFNVAALFGNIVRALIVKLSTTIVSLLIITDPIIIMRNADVKEAFNILMKHIIDYCHKILQRIKTNGSSQEQNMELVTMKELL